MKVRSYGRVARLIGGAAATAVLVSACAVGPDFKRPEPPTQSGYYPTGALPAQTASAPIPGGDPQRFAMGRDIRFQWWTVFGSPKLDALVDKALAANPTITAAQAALKQAQEQVTAQRGFFYPTVQANFQPTRQQLAGNLGGNSPGIQGNGNVISTYQNPQGPAPFNGPVVYNFYTAQLSLSYTLDVFGGNRRQLESLKSQAESLRFQMEGTYVTLVTNVVAAAIQEASLEAQIKATKAFIAQNETGLRILKDQQRFGYVMRLDVAAQEQALAQAKALLPPLQKQLDENGDLIRALLGGAPTDSLDLEFDLDQLRLPADLPVSAPSTLIDQRPDVRAAEEQLHSASAQVGVALANRLPQFTLTAADGGGASQIAQMFTTGGPFWSLIGDASQTLFDGGTLKHRQRAAEQALVQARAQYRTTLIGALQNVADTLHAVQSDADALAAQAEAEAAAKTTLDVTTDQYKAGYVNDLVLLSAQEAYQQARISRLLAETNRFGDAAALYQALGGGWWNRERAEGSQPRSLN